MVPTQLWWTPSKKIMTLCLKYEITVSGSWTDFTNPAATINVHTRNRVKSLKNKSGKNSGIYLGHYQTLMVKLFGENSQHLNAVYYFRKKTPS